MLHTKIHIRVPWFRSKLSESKWELMRVVVWCTNYKKCIQIQNSSNFGLPRGLLRYRSIFSVLRTSYWCFAAHTRLKGSRKIGNWVIWRKLKIQVVWRLLPPIFYTILQKTLHSVGYKPKINIKKLINGRHNTKFSVRYLKKLGAFLI